MKHYICLFTICLTVVFFNSCKKSIQTPHILSTEEYINYTINGYPYSFLKSTDKLSSADYYNNPQPPPSTMIYGEKIPNPTGGATVNILFERTGVTQGSNPVLTLFYTQQSGIYPHYTTSSSQITIKITEYGNVGEYIAGNFSGLFIGVPPSYNQYNMTCNFRIKRVI